MERNTERPESSDSAAKFVSDVVLPAFRKIREKLEKPGRMIAIEYSGGTASIIVVRRGKLELSYRIFAESGDPRSSPMVETKFVDIASGREVKSQPESLSRSSELLILGDAREEDITESFNEHYRAVTGGRQ